MARDNRRITHDPEIQATRNTSYLTASKSLNGRKIARMAPILTIFGPNRSRRPKLKFEKKFRAVVAVVVGVVVVGRRRRCRRRRRRRISTNVYPQSPDSDF